MRIIKVIKEDVVANQVIKLDLCDNKAGDTVVGDIYIDLPTNNTVSVEGCVDSDMHTLSVVDMANYSVVSSITSAGYYMVPAAGLSKLKLTFGSAGSVTIKETF